MQELHYNREQLEAVCRAYHVKRLAVFGSVLRGEQRPESDLDLLVEFEPGKIPGLFRFFHIQRELTEVFQRNVDLSSAGFLHKSFREEVKQHAQPIYAG